MRNRTWNILIMVFLGLLTVSCGTTRSVPRGGVSPLQDEIIGYSREFLGTPYRHAGRSPAGFDCSGYTQYVYKKFGYQLDASSALQARQFPQVNRRQLAVGDLVFFEGSRHDGQVGHVGIVSEVKPHGEFAFIHASTSRGVIVSSSEEKYYANRYLRAGRVLNNSLIGRSGVKPAETASSRTVSTRPVLPKQNTPAETPPQNTTGNGTGKTHTVQQGDTLYSISRKYNVTVEQLRQWNPTLGDVLYPGRKLRVSESN